MILVDHPWPLVVGAVVGAVVVDHADDYSARRAAISPKNIRGKMAGSCIAWTNPK